jgi:hypothetical protein
VAAEVVVKTKLGAQDPLQARDDLAHEVRERLAAVADRLVRHRQAHRVAYPDRARQEEPHVSGPPPVGSNTFVMRIGF